MVLTISLQQRGQSRVRPSREHRLPERVPDERRIADHHHPLRAQVDLVHRPELPAQLRQLEVAVLLDGQQVPEDGQAPGARGVGQPLPPGGQPGPGQVQYGGEHQEGGRGRAESVAETAEREDVHGGECL